MSVKFGPAGMGPVKDVEKTFAKYKELGLKACEIPFTYQVYIKDKETAEKIKNAAEKNNIQLTVHAPYWINLNSKDIEKVNGSKKRILDSCKVGSYLGAKLVVFHCGFFEKIDKEESYLKIKKAILEIQEEIKNNKWDIQLAPEIMGKINVFGSIDEIHKLHEETGCGYCIDFAHILARYKEYKFKEVFEKFKDKELHIHFSGIEYGEKGEKHHQKTGISEWKKLILNLPDKKDITIINESPMPVEDSVLGLKLIKTR